MAAQTGARAPDTTATARERTLDATMRERTAPIAAPAQVDHRITFVMTQEHTAPIVTAAQADRRITFATMQERGRAATRDVDAKRVTFRFTDRPSVRFGTIARVDLRLGLTGDLRASDAPFADDESARTWSRKRIGIDGRIGRLVSFQVEREFGSGDRWRDVYMDYDQFDAFRAQAGKFKLPFGLDENTSYRNLDFVYRAAASETIAPGRDRGAMAHGRLLGRRLEYFAGVFAHDGANARRNNPAHVSGGATFAARLLLQPFRSSASALKTLEVGGAYASASVPVGYWAPHGKTAFGLEFWDGKYYVSGAQRRQGVEARWRPGPFSVRAEYLRLTTERRGQSVASTSLPILIADGWYVSGTWAMTGERKADGLDHPRRPITAGGPGALELAARVETLGFRSASADGLPSSGPRAAAIEGNRLRAVTVGVNWYPMRWVKVQLNLIRETLADPSLGPLPASPSWSRVTRLLFAW